MCVCCCATHIHRLLKHDLNLRACVQTLGAGTFDEVFGPGNTPMWARPTDVVKYRKDQLIATEQGFNLQNVVSISFFAVLGEFSSVL